MPFFISNPTRVEAKRLVYEQDQGRHIKQWLDAHGWAWKQTFDGLVIKTLEGEHLASWGDWVIKGVKGEFYPCKPDIFKVRWRVDDSPSEDA